MPGALPAETANCGFHIYAAIGSSEAVVVPFRCQARRTETKSNILARARAHSRSLRGRPTRASIAARAAASFAGAGPDCQRAGTRLSGCEVFSEVIRFPSISGVFHAARKPERRLAWVLAWERARSGNGYCLPA